MEKTLEKIRWNIDPMHSEVQFKVKHLVISTVTGNFNKFSATLDTVGDGFEGADVHFDADIASISTNNEQRDSHLQSADFFDAASFPQLTFASTAFRKISEEAYEVTGDLTIRGTTRSITLQAEYGGTTVDPYGQTKAGFEAVGKISRKEFGLTWNATTEAGGVVVSDEVKLILNVQFIKG